MVDYTVFTLDNGLRVVHHFDSSPAHVAVDVLYNVGARDESPSLTGIAHLFEHLMFGGSVNIPEYDAALEAAGGTSNAWTSNDFTNFYDILPAANIETALWLESDRMLSPAFTTKSLDTQRSVVVEEFKQTTLNKPFGDLMHHLRPMVYGNHPYATPTIGLTPDHIERVTMDDVKHFFFSHYAPNNAVLSISGPIGLERVRHLAQKWFGSIPRRDITPRTYGRPAPINGPLQKIVRADVPHTRLVIAFPMDAYGTKGYRAADLITDILSVGNSSRFYNNLLMATDLFASVDASISGSEEEGMLMIFAALTDNEESTIHRAEEAILTQLHQMATEPVCEKELERVKNRFECNLILSQLSYVAKAREIAKSVMRGEDYNSILPAYQAITSADILQTAATLFRPENRATLIYTPS